VHLSSPPFFLKEEGRNLHVVGFVGEQITSVLQQRPKISEAGLKRVQQIDIQENQHAGLGKMWQGLIEIANIEMTSRNPAVF
jgi:hypothetical protein